MAAVKHELFPRMGTAVDAVVEGLKDDGKWNADDLGKESVQKVIEGMKEKRKMTTNQVAYIERMVLRANEFAKSSVDGMALFESDSV